MIDHDARITMMDGWIMYKIQPDLYTIHLFTFRNVSFLQDNFYQNMFPIFHFSREVAGIRSSLFT